MLKQTIVLSQVVSHAGTGVLRQTIVPGGEIDLSVLSQAMLPHAETSVVS